MSLASRLPRFFFSVSDRLIRYKPPSALKKTEDSKSSPASEKQQYPLQHPVNLEAEDSSILTRDKPVRYIEARFETPYEIYKEGSAGLKVIDQPVNPRCLEIALIGSPNAGKSRLFNRLIESPVSAVSNKANTTYDSIIGYRTNHANSTQLMLYDTPGITKTSKLSRNYITRAWEILGEVDKALFVVDAVKSIDDKLREALKRLNNLPYNEAERKKLDLISNLDKTDPFVAEQASKALSIDTNNDSVVKALRNSAFPKVLVLNKMDLCTNRKKLNWLVAEMEDLSKFEEKFFVSSETGFGIERLIEYLTAEAPPRKWQRHSFVKSDLSKIEILEQIMKAALFSRYFEELPYQIGVALTEYSERSDGVTKLHFVLDVETPNQKKIVTGHGGRNILELISVCRMEMARAFQREMVITVHVKYRKESLERSNQFTDDITPENFSEESAKQILESAKKRREQLKAQLEQALPYPI